MNEGGTYRTTAVTAELSTETNGITNIQLVDDEGVPIETDAFLVEGLGGAELQSLADISAVTAELTDMTVSVGASVSVNTITTTAVLA